MNTKFITGKNFKNEKFTTTRLPRADYEECVFEGCQFQNGFLDNQNFAECEFMTCDLSNTNIKHSIFNDVTFRDCKLIGLRFEDVNGSLISLRFENCMLDFASFFGLRMKHTVFKDCSLVETDFTETDLTASTFTNSNLNRAVFEQTILTKANFTTVFNLALSPENNQIKKAIFSKESVLGLLKKYDIVIE
ncbi:pentapeptide repeat-containing protein [Croceitalea marina]|uniref:Pentapeptide repeat-containing protein n=1 Tax=Croceitalea marina TaxID=1775166 RepID=A0ABW5N191_9FLAO